MLRQPNTERRARLKRQMAHDLRAGATDAERKMWALLRKKQMAGLRFRRQHPIGPYIVDFYCSAAKLIIELDGGQHGEDKQLAYDKLRDAWLGNENYRVLRFENVHFLKHPDAVLEGIWLAIKESGIPLPPT